MENNVSGEKKMQKSFWNFRQITRSGVAEKHRFAR
jgi:hypothetical protein